MWLLSALPQQTSPLAMMPTGPLALPSTAKPPESAVAACHRSLLTPNMLSSHRRTYSHVSILKADPLPLSHLRGPRMLMDVSYFCLEAAVNKAAMDTAITYVLSMDRSTDTHLCWVRT